MEGILWLGACGVVAFLVYVSVMNTIRKTKEEKASKDENKMMRELEIKLMNQEILTAEKFQQMNEQEKARIEKDWGLAWDVVRTKIIKTARPEIVKLVGTGMSTIGIFEAVMNSMNWNYLLEGNIPQIPPSGRDQINELVQKMIDEVRDQLKK